MRPLSLRLDTAEVEALQERAQQVAGAPSAVARDLIRSGLAGGDPEAQGNRLLMIERRLVAIDRHLEAIRSDAERQEAAIGRIAAMFEALLGALAGEESGTGVRDGRDD
jgi:hypothetical protein